MWRCRTLSADSGSRRSSSAAAAGVSVDRQRRDMEQGKRHPTFEGCPTSSLVGPVRKEATMAESGEFTGLCGAAPERAPGVQCDRDGHRRRQQRERELCRLPLRRPAIHQRISRGASQREAVDGIDGVLREARRWSAKVIAAVGLSLFRSISGRMRMYFPSSGASHRSCRRQI